MLLQAELAAVQWAAAPCPHNDACVPVQHLCSQQKIIWPGSVRALLPLSHGVWPARQQKGSAAIPPDVSFSACNMKLLPFM